MEIELLSKMVKEIILDADSVTLPGLGSFVAEVVPSSFSDRGYTINPPYRRLYFSPREGTDTLLVDFYSRSNNIGRDDATRIIVAFLQNMKEELKESKAVVFPSLGRLRATRQNNFFFVADEDLDIYPYGFGLEPLSLKTHKETESEVSAAVAGLAAIISDDASQNAVSEGPDAASSAAPCEAYKSVDASQNAVSEGPDAASSAAPCEAYKSVDASQNAADDTPAPAAETTDMDDAPAPAAETTDMDGTSDAGETSGEPSTPCSGSTDVSSVAEQKPAEQKPAEQKPAEQKPSESERAVAEDKSKARGRSAWKGIAKVLGIAAFIALVALAALAIIGRTKPELIDKYLYSAEELELLNM